MIDVANQRRSVLRDVIREVFPTCPEDFLDRFVELAAQPTDRLRARAERVLHKPYGQNHILCSSGHFGVSFAWMRSGQTTSLHRHAQRTEFFLVRSGCLTLRTPPTERVLIPGQHGSSVPGQAHALANRGDETLEFIEIFAPPLLDDKHRIFDPYDRRTGDVRLHE